ncbi:MAG: two-component system, LuxR family, response regulator FixJ [Porphyrobacter sp. HL-46]|nr:MAG: two-component system, LuxR family, response regulator FixJ [Porphyrobacter sp. HL-46]
MKLLDDDFENIQNHEAHFDSKLRLYVIDDDSDIRKSLHFMFSPTKIRVWPFASASDFLEQLQYLTPGPILLDIRMENIDGLQLLEILKQKGMTWPVVILTAHGDVAVAVRAMKLGAIDFLEKPFPPEALDLAVEHAFERLEQAEHVLSARDRARYRIGQLTARERETMAILMEGVPNKEVAHRLCLSVRTVEMHRANALAKLNVKSIAEVVRLANIGGLTPEMRMSLENGKEN